MGNRMHREACEYQNTITQLEEDIDRAKVITVSIDSGFRLTCCKKLQRQMKPVFGLFRLFW